MEDIAQMNATETSKLRQADLMIEIQEWAQRMISAQSWIGRGLVTMVFLLSFGSLFIYFVISIETSEDTQVVLRTLQVVDMGFNSFFLFYFGLRFIAADDKLRFWVELNSIVDFFTIPPVVLSLYLNQDCVGLRFMRSLRLLQLPEILQYLRILKRHTKIKLASLLSVFVGAWLTAAGFIYTIENSGDPWQEENNSQPLTYWQCVYLLMVTMSTVGYGDLTARTSLGQVFMVFFIILGLVLFASHVPEIIELIGSHRKYTGSYRLVMGKKHIIVCGHITLTSLHEFLKDFSWKEREECSTNIVILEDFNPGLELQAMFKRHVIQMQFFQGSVLKPSDLVRIQLDKADACLILADKNCLNPEAEDSANIMRAVAVKQYSPEIRIIAQVLQYHSKAYLQNLPSWNMKHRDSVICLSELKMGFIAQNCIVPGFSTLLANLFIKKSQMEHKTGTWLDIYQEGVSQEIFTEFLSEAFVGMSFPAVCQICYIKLKLLLIAVQYRTSEESVSILINPDASIVIQEQTLGFFIAKKRSLVQRANFYCTNCHYDISDNRRIKKCSCKKLANNDKVFYGVFRVQSFGVLPRQVTSTEWTESTLAREKVTLDSTGMFHWCPPKAISQVTLSRAMASRLQLSKHVIVCIFSEPKCPGIGLRNFVMPLRASSFTYDELKSIVFVVSLEYIAKEWETISNFPKIFILPGSPLCRADLKAASIGTCDMTVVISSNRTHFEEKSLQDKECILATLNLKAMLFEEVKSTDELPTMSSETVSDDTGTSASIDKHYYRVPIITSLVHQSNVYFLDQEDRDEPDTDLYLTQPYASGCVFAFSILNSLTCMTYFNDNILLLIRTLVTGGASPELDEQLADEDALRGNIHAQDNMNQRNRCKLARITMCDKRFEEFAHGGKYGDLFCKALLRYGILCFGIFRLQDPAKQSKKRHRLTPAQMELDSNPNVVTEQRPKWLPEPAPVSSDWATKLNPSVLVGWLFDHCRKCDRFVITNPSSSFELIETDFIMCTVPFYDIQSMATNMYCQMNYFSKFIPLHAVARQSSTAMRPVRFDRSIYSHDYTEQVKERTEKDRGPVEKSTIEEAEEPKKTKTLDHTMSEQFRELLKAAAMRRASKEKRKSSVFVAVQHHKEVDKSGEEPQSLKSEAEVELEIIIGEEMGRASPKPAESGSAAPVATTPGPGAQPVATTPGPGAQPVATTPGPGAQPVATTPGPGAQPVATTPGPGAQPVATTPGPGAQPVATTPGPGAQPVATTPGPGAQPEATTPGPGAQPVATTPGPGAQLVATTPKPSVENKGVQPEQGPKTGEGGPE
ncbi:calcium-activated potassium channel subunit alpha-1-like [Pristis pectinata]|uniref:calcium-activated potassium channel subunit alpha-1-like n=1 Tax=Pristis pectinata TaxID=685728 RepID=UPI00223D2435|nr:calcium-activated potassium channel subunit alpha-1-like [Pristis pectinata]